MYNLRRTIKEISWLNRPARKIYSFVSTFQTPRPYWKFELDYSVLGRFPESNDVEMNSGIHAKISALKLDGPVEIVGGKTAGGNDDIFQMDPDIGCQVLIERMKDAANGTFFILHVPHPFWTNSFGGSYKWLPSWQDLYHLIYSQTDWRVFQFSPSFDACRRYFIIAQKTPRQRNLTTLSELSRKTYRVFYFREGVQQALGRSNQALSANLCAALTLLGAKVYAYDFTDIECVKQCHPSDILIGHVGPWVKEAYNHGCKNIILFNPSNSWYPTRNNNSFENNATLEEQVALSKLVIAQSGSIWRLTANNPTPEKWRWIDLGVERSLFPRVKYSFNPPGKRKFLFFHLYDNAQKGADVAKELIRNNPFSHFAWLDCVPLRAQNIKSYSRISNTSSRFRKIVGGCDFILVPSREDAQPGTLIEAVALGLIASASYSSGYSISFPSLVHPNSLDQWQSVLDYLQNADNSELDQASVLFQHYLDSFHNWHSIQNLILFYLREGFV